MPTTKGLISEAGNGEGDREGTHRSELGGPPLGPEVGRDLGRT